MHIYAEQSVCRPVVVAVVVVGACSRFRRHAAMLCTAVYLNAPLCSRIYTLFTGDHMRVNIILVIWTEYIHSSHFSQAALCRECFKTHFATWFFEFAVNSERQHWKVGRETGEHIAKEGELLQCAPKQWNVKKKPMEFFIRYFHSIFRMHEWNVCLLEFFFGRICLLTIAMCRSWHDKIQKMTWNLFCLFFFVFCGGNSAFLD